VMDEGSRVKTPTPTRGSGSVMSASTLFATTYLSSVTVSMGEERKGVLSTMLRVTLGCQRDVQTTRSGVRGLSSPLSLAYPVFLSRSPLLMRRSELGGLCS
jgi:hypothetical protein